MRDAILGSMMCIGLALLFIGYIWLQYGQVEGMPRWLLWTGTVLLTLFAAGGSVLCFWIAHNLRGEG